MKYCDECSVNVDIPLHHCPLCNTFLRQKDEQPEHISYPNLLPQAEAYNLIFRIMVFFSLTLAVVCVTVNILTFKDMYWSFIIVAIIIYAWISISTALDKNKNIYFTIMVQVLSLGALLVVLSFLIDTKDVIYTYVFPALFVSATLCITVIVIVKRMQFQEFVLYFILTALLGFIPLLLMVLNLITVDWPAIVSAIYSGLSLVSLFIFADNTTKVELRKRFNL